MNIYEFFNSRDIADYCQEIGHRFTATEIAYLIWYSDHHTILQKHAAWMELMETMPDEEIPCFCLRKETSIFQFLCAYMQEELDFLLDMTTTKPGYIYSYEMCYQERDGYYGGEVFFDNYRAAAEAIAEEIEDECECVTEVRLVRRQLHARGDSLNYDKDILAFTPAMDPLRIDENSTEKKHLKDSDGFYDLWVEVPTPFVPGDVVSVHSAYGNEQQPMVLSRIPYWTENELGHDRTNLVNRYRQWGDWTDMQGNYWQFDEKGELYAGHGPEYLSLEYHREKLDGKDRFLFVLGNYLKKKIYVDDLIRSYAVFMNKDRADYHRGCSGKVDEIQRLSGLIEDNG